VPPTTSLTRRYFWRMSSLTFNFGITTRSLQKFNANTYFDERDKDPVALEVDFQTLADGMTNCISAIVLMAPARDMQVVKQYVNYQRVAPKICTGQ